VREWGGKKEERCGEGKGGGKRIDRKLLELRSTLNSAFGDGHHAYQHHQIRESEPLFCLHRRIPSQDFHPSDRPPLTKPCIGLCSGAAPSPTSPSPASPPLHPRHLLLRRRRRSIPGLPCIGRCSGTRSLGPAPRCCVPSPPPHHSPTPMRCHSRSTAGRRCRRSAAGLSHLPGLPRVLL
jgi:hypothetical protein